MSDWAEIMDEMNKRAREHEEESRATNRRVREQLLKQQSSFLKDFTEAEARIHGLIK